MPQREVRCGSSAGVRVTPAASVGVRVAAAQFVANVRLLRGRSVHVNTVDHR